MHNGIPWQEAMSLGDAERAGMSIIFSEFNGHKFNTHTMKFEDPS